jgi:hypothetical protein
MVTRTLRQMGITGHSIHGLRKNAGKALAEAGCGEREIMAILGHKTFQMAAHDGEFIEVRQQKTDELLSIPCHRVLRDELETMPRRADTILVGERGKPLTAASLSVMDESCADTSGRRRKC